MLVRRRPTFELTGYCDAMDGAGVLHVTAGPHVCGAGIIVMRGPAQEDAHRRKKRGLPLGLMNMATGEPAPLGGSRLAFKSGDPDFRRGRMRHRHAAFPAPITGRKRAPVIWSIHHSLHDIETEAPLTAKIFETLARMPHHAFPLSDRSRTAAGHHEGCKADPRRRVIVSSGVDAEKVAPNEYAPFCGRIASPET